MNSPVKTKKLYITSYFGERTYKYKGKYITDFHTGIDLTGGSEIIAFEDGKVTYIQNKGKQYGTMCQVILKHSNGYYTRYYHLKSGSVKVKVGQNVKKGTTLGTMGKTGQATGVHLHFQIDKGSIASAVNPYDYIFKNKKLVPEEKPTPVDPFPGVSDEELACRVWRGEFGNGEERKKKLGSRWAKVQELVDKGVGKDTPVKPKQIIHFVKKGEYIIKIARKYGVNWQKLAKDNNVKAPDYIIRPGQKLKVNL